MHDLEEESDNLATGVLATGLLVGHETVSGGQDQVSELTGREDIGSELFDLSQGHIETRGDDSALVQSADEVDDDLSGTVVIDDLEITDVLVLLHAGQELHDDLGGGLDENLTLATLLGVDNVVHAVVEDGNLHHFVESTFWSKSKYRFNRHLSRFP